MTIIVTTLTERFGAEISGVDLTDLSTEDIDVVRAAFDAHGVIVVRSQLIDNDQQVAFSEQFGPLETTVSVNPAVGTPFARQSTIDMATGETMKPDDKRISYQKGNMLWHADSTFKEIPSLCSMLTAREVPHTGGDTEFASTRTVYEALDPATQARLDGCVVEHDFAWSRARSGFVFNDAQRAENAPARHPLVQTNPVTGRKSLMIGAHAKCIVGWNADESHTMLEDLLDRATAPNEIYVHKWQTGDTIVWDNRATLHRATPFDVTKHRRLMQRTTISNPAAIDEYAGYPEISQAG